MNVRLELRIFNDGLDEGLFISCVHSRTIKFVWFGLETCFWRSEIFVYQWKPSTPHLSNFFARISKSFSTIEQMETPFKWKFHLNRIDFQFIKNINWIEGHRPATRRKVGFFCGNKSHKTECQALILFEHPKKVIEFNFLRLSESTYSAISPENMSIG